MDFLLCSWSAAVESKVKGKHNHAQGQLLLCNNFRSNIVKDFPLYSAAEGQLLLCQGLTVEGLGYTIVMLNSLLQSPAAALQSPFSLQLLPSEHHAGSLTQCASQGMSSILSATSRC